MCNQMNGYDYGIDGFEDGYIAGYLDGLDDLDDDDMDDMPRMTGIGAISLDNFPTVLVAATIANTVASKDEWLNSYMDKLNFLKNKEKTAVRKEFRGCLKTALAGVVFMVTDNAIVQGAALGLGISAANDFYEFAKEKGYIKIGSGGAVGYTPNTRMISYEELGMGDGMNGWNEGGMDFQDVQGQEVRLERI